MSNFGCNCRSSCTLLSVVASLVIGIITAFLTITAAITVTPAFLWVVLGVAVVYLAILLFTRGRGNRGCICNILPVLLAGILGAILLAVVLLAISFAATSIIGAIITGLLLAFFSLIFTTTACLVSCEAGCDD